MMRHDNLIAVSEAFPHWHELLSTRNSKTLYATVLTGETYEASRRLKTWFVDLFRKQARWGNSTQTGVQ